MKITIPYILLYLFIILNIVNIWYDDKCFLQDGEEALEEEVNYAALDFPARKAKGKKKMKKREMNSESIYSAVRVDWQ